MDITLNELKTMKAKQLRRLIREAINEVLAEAPDPIVYGTDSASKTAAKKKLDQTPKFRSLKQFDQQALKTGIDQDKDGGVVNIGEGDLDELARLAKGFRLADPNFDASQYANKRVSGTSMADIINFFRENPGAEKTQLQAQFGFARPQIANAIVNGLLDAGVLVKLGAGGEVEATPEPGEEAPVQATEPEDLFMGSAENPLAMYFDNEPNADGSEDITDEPEAGELEKTTVSTSSMSDEDFEAFMEYSKLADRLAATKSNILKIKRSKGTAVGDIKDKPSTEEQRLRDLKKSLEDRIKALVAGSDYLKKRTGQETAAPEIEDIEDEEPIAEGLDEYTKRKMQFYAGIIK